jgi:glycosyltransferase involved in cell wall biosynthesis
MVRIGLDLTAVPAQRGGVAFYLMALIAALQRIDRRNEYVLITADPHAPELRSLTPNFSIAAVKLPSRGARLLWEQASLPGLVARLGLDLLHSPHYTRPLRPLGAASVVGVMDLTFFLMPAYHTRMKRLFFRAMLPASVRRADRLIAISESTRRDLERVLHVPPSRVDVTPLAVSAAYHPNQPEDTIEALRQRYGLPREYLLYVGRLEPRKNLPRLLAAYEHVLGRKPEMPPLVLAGAPGWHWAGLEKALQRLGSRTIQLGYVPESDLPALYGGATIFIYPSMYEGFGIPVLEALSCGTPTITSNVSSMPEVVADAAELIDPHSTADIAAAMERLLTDAKRREELREKGLRRASAFSWDHTARLTMDSYLRAIDGADRTR